MDESRRPRWLPTVLLVGGVYLAAGIAFGALSGRAASSEWRVAWRLAAWLVSAAAFAAHIVHELGASRSPRTAAWRAALAAALGAFGLAIAANVHAWSISSHRPAHFLALVAWPVVTALPAFLVALAAAVLWSLRRTG